MRISYNLEEISKSEKKFKHFCFSAFLLLENSHNKWFHLFAKSHTFQL